MSSLSLEYATRSTSRSPAFLDRLRRQREAGLVLAGLAALLIMMAFGRWLAPINPFAANIPNRLQAPSRAHIMGTDALGRDVFSRVLAGAGISITSALVIIVSAVLVGMLVGAAAGYFGGLIDDVIMRLTDCFLAFPALVLALAIAGALGPSLTNAIWAVAAVWWPWYARLARGQVLAIKQEPFVEAARCLGCGDARIIGVHIVPNFLAPILVQATLDIGAALVTMASLSYIGMGAQPPSAEWGAALNQARQFFLDAWWLTAFPGMAIFLTVLLFNAAGDLVHAALPK